MNRVGPRAWLLKGVLLVGCASCSGCYGGGGVGGGVALPSGAREELGPVGQVNLSHGFFGGRGSLGLEHGVTAERKSVVFGMDLEAKRFWHPARHLRLYPELSLGLFELGHDEQERLVGGFASPGLGVGAWWRVDSDLAFSLDAGAEYRLRPWDTSVPTVLISIGVLKLAPLFEEGQGFH